MSSRLFDYPTRYQQPYRSSLMSGTIRFSSNLQNVIMFTESCSCNYNTPREILWQKAQLLQQCSVQQCNLLVSKLTNMKKLLMNISGMFCLSLFMLRWTDQKEVRQITRTEVSASTTGKSSANGSDRAMIENKSFEIYMLVLYIILHECSKMELYHTTL